MAWIRSNRHNDISLGDLEYQQSGLETELINAQPDWIIHEHYPASYVASVIP